MDPTAQHCKHQCLLVASVFILISPLIAQTQTPANGERVFKLTPVHSVFDLEEPHRSSFIRGQMVKTQDTPLPAVTAYPKSISDRPLYGSIRFGSSSPSDQQGGTSYYFFLDKSKTDARPYDRLYMDLNQDADLSNDKPLLPSRKQPEGSRLLYSGIAWQACFDPFDIALPCAEGGNKPLELIARVCVADKDVATLTFITTRAHRGTARINGQRFDVLMGHNYLVTGWFDDPMTALHLLKDKTRPGPRWWGADRQKALHMIGGQYYRFSATSAGDTLTASPYQGAFGTFKVGVGHRKLSTLSVQGSIESHDMALAIGKNPEESRPPPVTEQRVPVGDYLPTTLHLQYGTLRIFLSQNYHGDGAPLDRTGRPNVYGMTVREDTPFVLDFTNTPEIMFAEPRKGLCVRPGEELNVKAILTDPQLDIMIRDLNQDGTKLEPQVVVTRTNGKKIAEGAMPFG